MKIFFKKSLFSFLLLLSLGAICFGQAKIAQGDEDVTGLQVSPVRFDWDLNSGDERTATINLKNYDNSTKSVIVEIEDFYVNDGTTKAEFFVPDSSHPLVAYDVINWIDIPKSVELGPGEAKDVTFRVKVPGSTPTGGYYGAIFFTSKMDDPGDGGTRILINQRIGALLIMGVKGSQEATRSGEVKDFSTKKKVFWNNPAEFIVSVFNSGNLHYKMQGSIDIYKFGEKLETIKLNPQVIYPEKVRQYDERWNFSSWAFGYYKAVANLFSEDGKIKLASEISFWVIPWKVAVAILATVIVVWIFFKFFNKKFEIKRKRKE